MHDDNTNSLETEFNNLRTIYNAEINLHNARYNIEKHKQEMENLRRAHDLEMEWKIRGLAMGEAQIKQLQEWLDNQLK